MGEELDTRIIQQTQDTLGKFIKKPPLTDKLLRKPPFKFLHDVVTSVINTTGFMQEIYTKEELLSENIKERDNKIAFLQKAIDHVVMVTGEPLKIRPSKTVAGHEADKTNGFLQALAKAILQSNNNSLTSQIIEKKSPTKATNKKAEKRDPSVSRKLDANEKQPVKKSSRDESPRKKAAVNESPKIATTKLKSSDKTKQEKVRHDPKKVDRDKKLESRETSKKSVPESGKKENSSKDSGHRKEVNDKERSKSKDRHHKTKTSTTVGDKNKARQTTKDNGKSSERDARKDTKNVIKRGSPEKNVKSTTSSEKKAKASSPEKSPEKKVEDVEEDINETPQVNGNAEPSAILLGSEQTIDGSTDATSAEQIQNGSNSASGRRTLSGRPPTGRPSASKHNVGKALDSGEAASKAESESAASTTQEVLANEQEQDVKRPSTSTIRRASARPPTARPAAPRVRVIDAAPEDLQSQESSKQVPISSIILDGDTAANDDDDDGFVVEEPPVSIQSEEILSKNGINFKDVEGKPHGSLVTQILETSKDLENGSRRPGTGFKRVQVDTSLLSDSARRKDRELFAREMDKLRESVQTLTKSANPLGKLIDYLQEDVDTMFRELEMWSAERRKHESALQKEESKTDLDLESLHNQLQEIEETIEVQTAKISTVKANIIRNEERIRKMVTAARI